MRTHKAALNLLVVASHFFPVPLATGESQPAAGEAIGEVLSLPNEAMPFSTSTLNEPPGLCFATFVVGLSKALPTAPPRGDPLGEEEFLPVNSLERSR